MTDTYNLKGMTCNGCRTSVENTLNAIPKVKKAVVLLEDEIATIEMENHLTVKELQDALPEKYLISKKDQNTIDTLSQDIGILNTNQSIAREKKELSKLSQLKPLFIILFYITTASFLLNYKEANWQDRMLDFMGLFYVVFSFFKMLDLKGFTLSFTMYDPLASRVSLYGKVYPFIEATLGVFFLMRFQIEIALITTIVILGITTIGVTRTLLSKKIIQCACLGTALKLPMTEATFIENAIMIIMAIVMLLTFI